MAMDINDFGLQHEAFGFGDTDYSQMANSNTEFLNLFGFGESREAKKIKKDYYARIDALPASDKAGKDALFAELESKLAALNAPKSDIEDVQKAKTNAGRGQKILGGFQKGLDLFGKATDLLGIGKKITGEEGAEGQSGDGGSTGGGSRGGGGNRTKSTTTTIPTWVWITGGVVVLGLGVLAIVKLRK